MRRMALVIVVLAAVAVAALAAKGGLVDPDLPPTLEAALKDPERAVDLDLDGVYGHSLHGNLPRAICKLTRLRKLNLARNGLADLPSCFEQLGSLETLVLWGNQFKRLPPELAKLPHLRHLDLSDNPWKHLSPELGKLAHLESLDISKIPSELKVLPPELAQLSHLKRLVAYNWWLEQLPPEITKLQNLEELQLASFPLKDLPSELKQLASLPALRSLTLAGQTLYTEGNLGLRTLPPEIGELQQLRKLGLKLNEVAELPAQLANLPLEELDLSSNGLRQLPAGLDHLTGLKTLTLNGNSLPTAELARAQQLLPNCVIKSAK